MNPGYRSVGGYLERADDLLLLIGIGMGATVIGCVLVILWTRIIRHIWPSRTEVLRIAVGLLGITVLSVLTYVILEH